MLAGAAAIAIAGRVPCPDFAEAQGLAPGKKKLIIRSLRFYDLETPVNLFDTFITPVDLFFVRNHMSEPTEFDADTYRLRVMGEVEHPLELSLRELKKMQASTVINTLECAGNGRAFHDPKVPGVQWQRGAVGNARWTGPRLRNVLERAGVKAAAKHVAFRGLDEPPGKVPAFIRSIPLDKAMNSDTLLAMQMNGSTLAKHHGYPVRALTPGWIGAASCKWLSEIRVLDKEFDGNFMKPGDRMPIQPVAPGSDASADTQPVTRLNVKSLISTPGGDYRLGRPIHIHGVAWAGDADVAKVEVSTDSGHTWNPAQLGKDHAKYAWRMWEYAWKPVKAGRYAVMARASDSTGRVQPENGVWNPSGYLWNGYDQIKIIIS